MRRAVLALWIALLVLACTPHHEEELDHPKPIPVTPDAPPPQPGDPMEVVVTQTPMGMTVAGWRYMTERKDLWLGALEEIDRDVSPYLPGWEVRITQPGDGVEEVNRLQKTIYVRWRPDGHEPIWEVLPQLRALVNKAIEETP